MEIYYKIKTLHVPQDIADIFKNQFLKICEKLMPQHSLNNKTHKSNTNVVTQINNSIFLYETTPSEIFKIVAQMENKF